MRVYLLWNTGANGTILDITNLVEDCLTLEPDFPRVAIINKVSELLHADTVLLFETEKEMREAFTNAEFVKGKLNLNSLGGELH